MVRSDHFSYETNLFQKTNQEHEWLVWNTCDICQNVFSCWLFVPLRLQICVYISIFLLLIVSAFCKRLSDMTMYMWLITLQKKLNTTALVFIYGSDFVLFLGRFLLGYGSLGPFVIRTRLFQNENQDHDCLILSPNNIFGSQRVPIWILVYRCFIGLGAAV
jgi:hypothetical protein